MKPRGGRAWRRHDLGAHGQRGRGGGGGAPRQHEARRQVGTPGRGLRHEEVLGRVRRAIRRKEDRKSTRLNSSHLVISYAVFCLKKKKITHIHEQSNQILTRQ